MGDLKEKLLSERSEKVGKSHPVKKLTKGSGGTRQISVRVNPVIYEQFERINDARGATNNAIINMLISGYVQENINFIED